MLYGLSDEMWVVGNVVCYGSGILSMLNVRDVRYGRCGMLEVCDVGGVGC